MTVKWQPENAEGSLWSATVTDGQQGWFEIQMERSPDGWDWAINHDRRFWGQESTIEKAKTAVAAQLEQTGQDFPRCEIRRFTENESGGISHEIPGLPRCCGERCYARRSDPAGARRTGSLPEHHAAGGSPDGAWLGARARRLVAKCDQGRSQSTLRY
jgi:hypothetical protein